MKYLILFLIIFLNNSNADEMEIRTSNITKNLRCLVCEGQSVYESNSNFAVDIKNFVKMEISNNKTDDEIYDFLRKQYGETILFNPTFSIKNFFLWFAPVLFFLIGGFIFFRRLSAK